MTGPSVAIFGPLGFIGQHIVPTFISALSSKHIASLSLFSRDSSSSKFDSYRAQGAKIVPSSFDDKSALVKTLQGSDVVISCMGTQGDYKKNKHVLMEACAEAGVKIYIPSEWGTDHRNLKYENKMFANKQMHHAQAKKLGLKVIAIYTGLIMETAFTKWLGFDTKARTWYWVGSGDDALAMTSQRDLGPLTLRTLLLAYEDHDAVPSNLRIYSENRSVNECKTVFEEASGEKLKLELSTIDDAEAEYEMKKDSIPAHMLGPLIPLLVAQGSFDHGTDHARDIVNPNEKYFKWRTIEDYAREVKGLPWEDGSPF